MLCLKLQREDIILRTMAVSYKEPIVDYNSRRYSVQDYDILGSVINKAIIEIQEDGKGKIIDVKLTSAATNKYINYTALILWERVKE